jgi:hypothetical protein
MRTRLFHFLPLLLLLAGCSTEKDRWVNQKYHEVTGHFNAYFNGEEAFKKAVMNFEDGEKLDFEKLLPYYYWPNEQQAPALFAPLDRAIEKSAKVVKNHSMVFSGKQKNRYVFKAYLLIARAKYYKHELLPALEACAYMVDNFGRLDAARDEVFFARLLAAQIHTRMGNYYQAEQQLDALYTKRLPKEQLLEAQRAYANFHAAQGHWGEAQQWTGMALELATEKEDKVRLTYINAQLYALLKMGYESARSYEEVLKLHPNNYDITFSAQIKRAENFDVYMEDIAVIEKELEKMIRDDKNITYRDQIYYVWALKRLDLGQYPEAEKLLASSVASSVDNPKQKGRSYLKLADIAFDFKEFVPAQSFYDSAIAVLPGDFPGLDTIKDRTQVLNELVGQLNSIALEDSLQSLYGMSNEMLVKKFQSYIDAKKSRDAEAARRAEIAALNAASNADMAAAGPQAGGRGGQWYFYNAGIRASGKTAFKKRWGDRKLEDHWRTAQKAIDGFGEFAVETDTATSDSALVVLPNDEYSVDYYLSRVLKNDKDYAASLSREAAATAEVGFIYKEGLNDLEQAEKYWNNYMEGHAKEQSTPKVLYGRYLLYGELANSDAQQSNKNQLLTNYPTSPYAKLLQGTLEGPEVPAAEQALYDEAYAHYQRARWRSAQKTVAEFKSQYKESALLPKITLLEAYILGGEGKSEEVESKLKVVVSEHKGTPEAERAAQILAMLAQENNPDAVATDPNSKGTGDQKVRKVEFPDQPKAPHKFILAVPAENAEINDLRNAFADFNKENFKFDNLKIQNIFYDQNTQLIIISGLRTKEMAQTYLQAFRSQGTSIEQYYPATQSAAFYINNPNFGKVYRDKVLKEYIQYFNTL